MSWLSPLVDAWLDRLATKVAQKVTIELDAALDRAENRLRSILMDVESRLLTSAGQEIASLVTEHPPLLSLQPDSATSDAVAEEIRAMLRRNVARRTGPSPEIPDR